MPKITDIKQQVKNTSRYSVYVDEKYEFSLSEWQLLDSGLKQGTQLSAKELDGLKQDSSYGKIIDNTFRWLAIRPRSEWEMDTYLARKSDDEQIVERVKNKLNEKGYINDLTFAQSWVESRHLTKSISKRRLKQELSQKRVSPEVIDEVVAADEVPDSDVLAKLIVKKQRQSRYRDKDKLMGYLARQGFSYSDIKNAFIQLED